MIQDVCSISAKFKIHPFFDFETLAHGRVQTPLPRIFDDVLAEIAARPRLRILQNDGPRRIRDGCERTKGLYTRCHSGALRVGNLLVGAAEIVASDCTVLPLDLPDMRVKRSDLIGNAVRI